MKNVTVSNADLRVLSKSHGSPGVRAIAAECLRLRKLVREHSRYWNGWADSAPLTDGWKGVARRHSENLARALGSKPAKKGGR